MWMKSLSLEVQLFDFLSFPWVGMGVCEIELSQMGKNSGNPDLVCVKFLSYPCYLTQADILK